MHQPCKHVKSHPYHIIRHRSQIMPCMRLCCNYFNELKRNTCLYKNVKFSVPKLLLYWNLYIRRKTCFDKGEVIIFAYQCSSFMMNDLESLLGFLDQFHRARTKQYSFKTARTCRNHRKFLFYLPIHAPPHSSTMTSWQIRPF